MKLSKSKLRNIYLERRKAFSQEAIELKSQQISDRIVHSFDWSCLENIHIFLTIQKQKEFNTQYLINFFWNLGKNLFVPKVLGDDLLCYRLTPETIIKKSKGLNIPEPVGIPIEVPTRFDVVIIPLLYCDDKGNRIGYGKGFYDRFLKHINKDVLKIGVNFFPPNEEIEDVSVQDIALDYLVTPDDFISFTSKSIK